MGRDELRDWARGGGEGSETVAEAGVEAHRGAEAVFVGGGKHALEKLLDAAGRNA